MPKTIPFDAARLRREAERCERLSEGMTDPALIRSLRQWADDYRREADGARRPMFARA